MEDFVGDYVSALHSGNLKDLYKDKRYSSRDMDKDMGSDIFEKGKTPLIYAIEWFQNGTSNNRREESVAMLNTLYKTVHFGHMFLDTIRIADNEGNTPLMYAAEILHIYAIKKIFLQYDKIFYSDFTATNRNGDTFLLKLLKAATNTQIENNTRKCVEEIVFELLTKDTNHNRNKQGRQQTTAKRAPGECECPAKLLEASDQQGRDVFDYLMQFGSVKCISAALGKNLLSKLHRQRCFEKWIIKNINEQKYSLIEPTLDGINGISSELNQHEFLNEIKFPISVRVNLIATYDKEEEFNADIKNLMIYLFKLSDFQRVDPSSGQSILHTLAAFISPDSKCHRDQLGDDLISHVLLTHSNAVNINAQDSKGYTVLMYAVKNRFSIRTLSNIIKTKDIDMTVVNNDGQTVMDMLDSDLSPKARSVVEKAYNKQAFSGQAVQMNTTLSLKQQIAFMRGSIDGDTALTAYQKKYFHQSLTCMESDYDLHTAGKLKTSEGMSDLHKRKLIGKRVYLCEELSIDENVLSHLIQYGVIDEDMQEEITKITTRRKKAVKLLSILPLRGPKAYNDFIKMLNNTNNEFVAQELEEFDPDAHVEIGGDETAAAAESQLLPAGGAELLPRDGVVVNRSPDGTVNIRIPMVTLPTPIGTDSYPAKRPQLSKPNNAKKIKRK